MTVATTNNRKISVTDDAVTSFPFNFQIISESDFKARLYPDVGSPVDLVLSADFSLNAGPWQVGGTMTTIGAPLAAGEVVMYRDMGFVQGTDLENNRRYNASVYEGALDELTLLIQQLSDLQVRSLQLPLNTAVENLTLPDPEALKLLQWKSDLSGFENITVAELGSFAITDNMLALLAEDTITNVADLILALSKTAGTGSAIMPKGTTAERDTAPEDGFFRFNSTLNTLESWYSGAWNALSTTLAVVLLTGNQSIAGIKTFTNNLINFTGASAELQIGGVEAVPFDVDGLKIGAFKDGVITEAKLAADAKLTAANGASWDLLDTKIASNSAFIDFASFIDGTYGKYWLEIINLDAVTTGQDVHLQILQSGSPVAGSNYYGSRDEITHNGISSLYSISAAAQFKLCNSLEASAARAKFTADIFFSSPDDTTYEKHFKGTITYESTAANMIGGTFNGIHLDTTAMDGLRIAMSSGNFNAVLILRGLKDS